MSGEQHHRCSGKSMRRVSLMLFLKPFPGLIRTDAGLRSKSKHRDFQKVMASSNTATLRSAPYVRKIPKQWPAEYLGGVTTPPALMAISDRWWRREGAHTAQRILQGTAVCEPQTRRWKLHESHEAWRCGWRQDCEVHEPVGIAAQTERSCVYITGRSDHFPPMSKNRVTVCLARGLVGRRMLSCVMVVIFPPDGVHYRAASCWSWRPSRQRFPVL